MFIVNEPNKCKVLLDALDKSLAKDVCMPSNFYLVLLEGEACHICGSISTHIGEVKHVQFIPNLAKRFLIKCLGEYIGKLIIGANTFNCNVAFIW